MDGVAKRLDSDAPPGFLLSGGLDSSRVCDIAQKMLNKPIRTFAISMDTDAIDLNMPGWWPMISGANIQR